MIKKLMLIVLCFKIVCLYGQQTGTFYFTTQGKSSDKKNAKTKKVITKLSNNEYKEIKYTRYENDWNSPNSYCTYTFEKDSIINVYLYLNENLSKTTKRIYKKQNDSLFTFVDYINDSIVDSKGSVSNLLPMLYQGKVVDFYKNGNVRFEAIYKNNKLISNLRWKENGEKDIDNVFEYEQVDIEPTFIDGSLNEFIRNELKYPEEALKQGIEGRVFLQFIIMEDGSIDGIRLLRSIHTMLDEESVRVIKLTNKKWLSGKINNQSVRVSFNIPINFKK